jgi:hypothetical protein
MALTIDDLYASPDHYLHSFEGHAAVFVPMDRAAYHRSIFLDGRISAAGTGAMRVPVATLTKGGVPRPARTGWIFHVAHCGSTLLARALDQAEANLVLREPLALRQTAVAPSPDRLALVAAMLGKRYRPEAPTIVKANVPVNFLLPDLIARDEGAAAIFLHVAMRDYLLAILRSDNHRDWLRRVTTQLARHLGTAEATSDAARAASLWLAQMRAFAAAIARMPEARSLDAEVFFAEPGRIVAAAARHLGVAMAEAEVDAVVAGPLFATYSKNPEVAFDNAARIARRRALEGALADEIGEAEAWIAAHGADAEHAVAVIARAALDA